MSRFCIVLTVWFISTACAASTLSASDHLRGTWRAQLGPPVRLVSAEKADRFGRSLPQVDDMEVQALLQDPELIFYSSEEMPRTYQDWSGSLPGVHWAGYNISANSSEPFGNGNLEFPWGHAAGTHRTNNLVSFHFLRLPRDAAGRILPVVWYRKLYPGDSQQGYAWVFPKGTIFGEVLQMRGPDGYDYTFELRLRTRISDEWIVDVFRPFPTSEALSQRIKQLRPNWQEQPALAQLVNHLDTERALRNHTLASTHPLQQAFRASMGVDELPPVGDDRLVAQLLTQTTFQSSLGTAWRMGTGGNWTCAPTTEAGFHIVPANYDAGMIEVDRVSCMRCHEQVGQHVNQFDLFRDWYGRIRGSDGIFTFHPFDPSSVSANGQGGVVRMRAEFVQAGILQRYDRERHPDRYYQRIPELE